VSVISFQEREEEKEEKNVNSFMYEPIIDMSNWALKDLYVRVVGLNEKKLRLKKIRNYKSCKILR
jgi:hypothetical protein